MTATIAPIVHPDVLAGATAGDEVAFARIVDAHHDDMVRVAFVVCGDAEVANEAVAAAWAIAWRKLGSLRDADRLRPWLCAIAVNEGRRLGRRDRDARSRVTEIPVAAVDDRPGRPTPTCSTFATRSRGLTRRSVRCWPCATSLASTRRSSARRLA